MTQVDLDRLRWAVEAMRYIKERRAELKELEDRARPALEEALGDATEGTLDGDVAVTWKYSKRRALDQRLLRTTFPEIYETCRTVTEVRRFEMPDEH
jgi:predicted phage-related endonuclease